jgi:hypothetical protein
MKFNKDAQFIKLILKLILLNAIIFWIFLFIARVIRGNIQASNHFSNIEEIIIISIFTIVFVQLSLLYHLPVFFLLFYRIKKSYIRLILFILPSLIFGPYNIYGSLPSVRIHRILSHPELARLPESAYDLKVYSWSTFMSGEIFIKFNATPEDINLFLSQCQILKGKECKYYSKEKMRLPHHNKVQTLSTSHEYFSPDPASPDWYHEEITQKGRLYEIQPEGYHYPGEIIIDDEISVVYIHLVFS